METSLTNFLGKTFIILVLSTNWSPDGLVLTNQSTGNAYQHQIGYVVTNKVAVTVNLCTNYQTLDMLAGTNKTERWWQISAPGPALPTTIPNLPPPPNFR